MESANFAQSKVEASISHLRPDFWLVDLRSPIPAAKPILCTFGAADAYWLNRFQRRLLLQEGRPQVRMSAMATYKGQI